MDAPRSVTFWLRQLEAGDPAAAQPLWERYFAQLVRLASVRLHGARRGMADEEDAALSAFDSFCRGAAAGRFPQLIDRNNLWSLLVTLTARKAIDLANHEGRLKRRGRGGSPPPGDAEGERGLEQVAGREPTPAFAAQVAEEYRRLLEQLDDGELRDIAVWKMEGDSNAEIARKLGCAEVTVERRLRLIRKHWGKETSP
jgi:DNA-directed RNA polymerase specialized sigma24 family protein